MREGCSDPLEMWLISPLNFIPLELQPRASKQAIFKRLKSAYLISRIFGLFIS